MSRRRERRKRPLAEDELIAAIERIAREDGVLTGPGVRLGIGHDCAVLSLKPGEELAWHVDDQVEGIHFRRWRRMHDFDTGAIGWKGAAAALSDLAAVGARPLGAQLALELPPDVPDDDVLMVVHGFTQMLAGAGVPLVGGNIAARPSGTGLSLSVSVAGAVKRGRAFRRDTARAGDVLFLSNNVPAGLAGAGLILLERGRRTLRVRAGSVDWRALAIVRFLTPRPRLELGLALARLPGKERPHAVTDTSDGVARDAGKIARASGLRAVLFPEALASEEVALAVKGLPGVDPLALAVEGGEDYELLVAASPAFERTRVARRSFKRIGVLERGKPGVFLRRKDGSRVAVSERGFRHRT